jgi:hypothetical protein
MPSSALLVVPGVGGLRDKPGALFSLPLDEGRQGIWQNRAQGLAWFGWQEEALASGCRVNPYQAARVFRHPQAARL